MNENSMVQHQSQKQDSAPIIKYKAAQGDSIGPSKEASGNSLPIDDVDKYIRVGTTLYKVLDLPMVDGTTKRTLAEWKLSTFKQDHKRGEECLIPKYEGFCTIPDHINYQRDINGFYNVYEPIRHIPKEGDFPYIQQLMTHIFNEQYEYGMDYLQLLYLRPLQSLPILLLVSRERNTGKTTFLNFLKGIFGDNATYNTNEAFQSRFNTDWVGKLIICVDEVLLNRREDSERLKNLCTAKNYKVEGKGKDKFEARFFGKFVLCSNNENYPVIIDSGETRYWVRKIGLIDAEDVMFQKKVADEIPAFLHHLLSRQLSTQEASRLWFTPEQLHTEALEKIIRYNHSRLELDMAEIILDIFDKMKVDEACFCVKDIYNLLIADEYGKIEQSNIRNVLKNLWNLEPAPNGRCYETYICEPHPSGTTYHLSPYHTGRFYKISRETLKKFFLTP